LCREIKAVVEDNTKVLGGPRVFGGMTMPPELILSEIRRCTK
jgi:pyruvate ferredoxin oxidoreductase alpha subunit